MPNISCTEFSRLLAETVESRQSVDSAVLREHAAECSDCRATWLDALLIDRSVARWKSAVPAVDLADTVLFRLAEQESAISAPMARPLTSPLRKTRRRLTRREMVTVIASCVAVCIAIFMIRLDRPPQAQRSATQQSVTMQPPASQLVTTRRTIAQSVPKHPAALLAVSKQSGRSTVAKSSDDARVDLLVRDASSAYLNLATEAAEAVTAVTVLVPPPDSSDVPTTSDANEERWVDEVQREFAPVTRQLSQAFEFLIQAVPAEKTPAT